VCGFLPNDKAKPEAYDAHQVPGLRKLASVLGLPTQGIVLDAVAIRDASTHDGQTFFPHVEKVFEYYPELATSIERVLHDKAETQQNGHENAQAQKTALKILEERYARGELDRDTLLQMKRDLEN
jgi:hypothetical protein